MATSFNGGRSRHSGTPALKHQKSIDLILYKTSNEFQMKKRALTFIDDTDSTGQIQLLLKQTVFDEKQLIIFMKY
jgi:hypothetical protein